MELSEEYALLDMEDSLWLVELNSNPQMGKYIWSIYDLVQKSFDTDMETDLESSSKTD